MNSVSKLQAALSDVAAKAKAAPGLARLPSGDAIEAGKAWAQRSLGPLDSLAATFSARMDVLATRFWRAMPIGGGISSLYDAPPAAPVVVAAPAVVAPLAVTPAPDAAPVTPPAATPPVA